MNYLVIIHHPGGRIEARGYHYMLDADREMRALAADGYRVELMRVDVFAQCRRDRVFPKLTNTHDFVWEGGGEDAN